MQEFLTLQMTTFPYFFNGSLDRVGFFHALDGLRCFALLLVKVALLELLVHIDHPVEFELPVLVLFLVEEGSLAV